LNSIIIIKTMNSNNENKDAKHATPWCNESSDSDVDDGKNVKRENAKHAESDNAKHVERDNDKKVERDNAKERENGKERDNGKKVELADRKVPLLVQLPVTANAAPPQPASPCPTCNDKDDYKMVHCRNSENCRHGRYCVFIHDGEDRGCPRCRCGTCKNDRRFKTIQCTYYKKCKNGSRCPFMHHETDRGCGTCGDNKYSHSSRASPAGSPAPVPRGSPASGSPVPRASPAPRARPREIKVSPGPSAWSSGASPLSSSPALPVAALSVPGSPVISEPASPAPSGVSRVYLFTQMAVEKYLEDGSTFVDKDGKKRSIYEKIDEILAEAPMIRNLLLSYFQNSRLDCLQDLYDRLEAIITEFPL
jgi:hypothetical protein